MEQQRRDQGAPENRPPLHAPRGHVAIDQRDQASDEADRNDEIQYACQHDEFGKAPPDRCAQRRQRGRQRQRDQQQESDCEDQSEREDACTHPAAQALRHQLARAPDLFQRRLERVEDSRGSQQ
jgi:hypothetical protein